MGVVTMGALKMDYRREVEKMLRKYPSYKRSMNVLPACVPSYEERVQGGEQEFISSTEKYAFIRAERRVLVEDVELALSFLSPKEKQLIQLTYFQEERPLINIIWIKLHMSKSTYYRQKDAILDKIVSLLYGKNAGTFGKQSMLS
jgi:DNA-directed RNA polymerase specialized sigma subunit